MATFGINRVCQTITGWSFILAIQSEPMNLRPWSSTMSPSDRHAWGMADAMLIARWLRDGMDARSVTDNVKSLLRVRATDGTSSGPVLTYRHMAQDIRRLGSADLGFRAPLCPLAEHIETSRVVNLMRAAAWDHGNIGAGQRWEDDGCNYAMRATIRREYSGGVSVRHVGTSEYLDSLPYKLRLIRSEPDITMLEMGWEPQD